MRRSDSPTTWPEWADLLDDAFRGLIRSDNGLPLRVNEALTNVAATTGAEQLVAAEEARRRFAAVAPRGPVDAATAVAIVTAAELPLPSGWRVGPAYDLGELWVVPVAHPLAVALGGTVPGVVKATGELRALDDLEAGLAGRPSPAAPG